MDATTKRHHLLLLALETAAIASIMRLLKRGATRARISLEIASWQIQASAIGGQSALAQLDASFNLDAQEIASATHTPNHPLTLPQKALDVALVATIVRTTLVDAYRQSQIATYKINEIDSWIWVVEDDNPCKFCLSMEGTIHPIDEEFESHPNCYCGPEPYIN